MPAKSSAILLILVIFIFCSKCTSNTNIPATIEGLWYQDQTEDIFGDSAMKFKKLSGAEPRSVIKIQYSGSKTFVYTSGTVSELGDEPLDWSDSFVLKKRNKKEWYFQYGDRKVSIKMDENENMVIKGLGMRVYNPAYMKKYPESVTYIFIKLTEELKAKLAADTIRKNQGEHYELIMEDYFNKGNYRLPSDADSVFKPTFKKVKKNKDYLKWCIDYRPITPEDRLVNVIIDSFINKNNPADRNPFGNNTDTANYFIVENVSPYNSRICTAARLPTKDGEYQYSMNAKIELADGSIKLLRSKRTILIRPY